MNPEFDCEACGEPLDDNGNCLNINCSVAHEQATRDAARETKKATASTAPRAFGSSGRVD